MLQESLLSVAHFSLHRDGRRGGRETFCTPILQRRSRLKEKDRTDTVLLFLHLDTNLQLKHERDLHNTCI